MAINEPLKDLGSLALLVAALGWLIKTIVADRLSTDALEHQVRFSRLHEKTAQTISELYSQLIDVIDVSERFALSGSFAPPPGDANNYERAVDRHRQFYKFLEQNRLYLPQGIFSMVMGLVEQLKKQVDSTGLMGPVDRTDAVELQRRKAITNAAWQAFENQIPKAKNQLEEAFRSILGEKHESQWGKFMTPNRFQLVILVLYFLFFAFSCIWIPWCENIQVPASYHGHTYNRIGYGWLWAGPRVVGLEPDPSTFVPEPARKNNQESGFSVLGEESMRKVVVPGLTYAEPDTGLMTLRFTALTAMAAAAYLLCWLVQMRNIANGQTEKHSD